MMASARTLYAIDLGSYAVKFSAGEVDNGRLQITLADQEVIDRDLKNDSEGSHQRAIEAFQIILKRNKINPKKMKRVMTALPGDQVYLRQIRSIALPEEELKSSLMFEARKHLPIEGDVLTDYQILSRTDQDLEILLAVTPREAVVRHLALLAQAAIEQPIIEVPVLSLINRVLLGGSAKELGETALFVHVGASVTHLAISPKEGPFFCREIPFAGNAFSKDIGEKMEIAPNEAEQIKLEHGIFYSAKGPTSLSGSEAGALSLNRGGGFPGVEGLVREIVRSVRYYAKEYGNKTVDFAFLSGGSSTDPALREHLNTELGQAFHCSDPFDGLAHPSLPRPENTQSFAQAIGMLLRGAREFFPDQFK